MPAEPEQDLEARSDLFHFLIDLIRLIFRQLQPFDRVARRVPRDIQTEFPLYQLCAKVRRLNLLDRPGIVVEIQLSTL
jgi:hypothetical protein